MGSERQANEKLQLRCSQPSLVGGGLTMALEGALEVSWHIRSESSLKRSSQICRLEIYITTIYSF